MRQRTPLQAFTAGLMLLAAACSDQNGPVTPSNQPEPSPLQSAIQGTQIDPNSLGRAVRGFGGFYFDAQGAPVVYLKNAAEKGAAVGALSPFLRAHGLDPSRVSTRKGDFDWIALERWQTRATVVALAVPGAVFVDADEASNRVLIGVERGAAARIRELVARSGIPMGAVIVRETEPIRFAATLRDRVRPIVGGLQINFPGFLCTLGFNANRAGQSSFITNSHCTNTQGGTEATPYWQPLQTVDPVQIGTEVDDPTYFRRTNGCPNGRRCRFSDASRAAYASGIAFTPGGIARTTGLGSITIDAANPTFSITAEGSAVFGNTVDKIGRTTGWTRGAVTNTCVNTGVSGSNIVQLCQTFVSAGVGAGDSGSPVFSQSGSDVTLLGILWGSGGSTLYVYSPIANIERSDELGPLTTF